MKCNEKDFQFCMATQRAPYYTPKEYLALERQASIKSELINGRIYAMAGASRQHNLIAGNVFREISSQLKGRACEAYISDMRLHISATGMFTYPDVMAVCGEVLFEDKEKDNLLNPSVIIEVLSPSTEAYDRGEKFAHYRRLVTLQEYLLISQHRVRIERFVRHGAEWRMTEFNELTAIIQLTSIGCQLALAEIYDKVAFATSEDVEPETGS